MPTLCSLTHCKCVSCVLCYICHESFCREHYDEHDHSFNFLLKSLNDQVKDCDNRLENINNEELIENCYEKLDQWRNQCHEMIDHFYQRKCQEMKQSFQDNIHQRQEKINELYLQIKQLLEKEIIQKEIINLLILNVQDLQKEMIKLEETTFHIDIQSLNIHPNSIQIEQRNVTHFNLRNLSSPYHSIDCHSNHLSKSLISNEQVLLICRMKYLYFINEQLITIKQIPWSYGRIWDMSWSTTLQCFLILAHYELYLIDQNTFLIQRIENIPRRNWWSCTCSKQFLFLSTYEYGSSIMIFSLQPSIELIKEWKSPLTCTKDESIKEIISNNETIALTIFNKITLNKRFELRSIEHFNLIWSIELDIKGECHNTLRACSLHENQWLISDFHHQRLFHIDHHGQLKTIYNYPMSPWYMNLFSSNILVISTDKTINFHQL